MAAYYSLYEYTIICLPSSLLPREVDPSVSDNSTTMNNFAHTFPHTSDCFLGIES